MPAFGAILSACSSKSGRFCGCHLLWSTRSLERGFQCLLSGTLGSGRCIEVVTAEPPIVKNLNAAFFLGGAKRHAPAAEALPPGEIALGIIP